MRFDDTNPAKENAEFEQVRSHIAPFLLLEPWIVDHSYLVKALSKVRGKIHENLLLAQHETFVSVMRHESQRNLTLNTSYCSIN